MTTLPLQHRPKTGFLSALDLTFTVLRERYWRMLAPYLLVGLMVGAILLLGGLMAPAIGGLAFIALVIALIGIAVSFTAASVAAYRIAGALLFGDPETHISGEAVGSTGDEIQAAHDRVVPMFKLFAVQGIMILLAIVAIIISLARPAFLLLVIPVAWYLGVRFSLAAPEVIMGEDDPFRALDSSWALTNGHVLKIVGVSVVMGIIGIVISIAGSLVGSLAGENAQAILDLLFNVLWLPVGPATTMAFWGLLRA